MTLDDFIDRGYTEAFGTTRSAAAAAGTCVCCGKPPVFHTEAGRREYGISGMCEPCFDELFAEPEEEA